MNTAFSENQTVAKCEDDQRDITIDRKDNAVPDYSEVDSCDIACKGDSPPLTSIEVDEEFGGKEMIERTRFQISEVREQKCEEGLHVPKDNVAENVVYCSKDRDTVEEDQFDGNHYGVPLVTRTKQEQDQTDFATILEEFVDAKEDATEKQKLGGRPTDPQVSKNFGFVRIPNDAVSHVQDHFQQDAKESEVAIGNETPPSPHHTTFSCLQEDRNAAAVDCELNFTDIAESKSEAIPVSEAVDETQQCDLTMDEFEDDDIASLEDNAEEGDSDYEPTSTDQIDDEDTTDNSDESGSHIECTKVTFQLSLWYHVLKKSINL